MKLPLIALLLLATPALALPPSAPSNLSASLVGDDVVLVWDGVEDAASYNVYRDGQLLGNASSTTFTDQTAMGTSMYWVTAILPGGESPPSNPAQAGPCSGPSTEPPFVYVNPEYCWDYVWETIDDITM